MIDFYEALVQAAGAAGVRKDAPMSEYTTFRIGGPADYLVTPEDVAALKAGLEVCRAYDVPYYIIGNGSNLLVGDDGWRGVIFRLCRTMEDISFESSADRLTVKAGAGCMLSRAAREVSQQGYTGFEFATGIPGSLGGGIAMNAGAYGGEIVDVIDSVRVMDAGGQIMTLKKDQMEMRYRGSRMLDEGLIILDAVFNFEKGDAGKIMARVDELTAQRREKQPIEYPSAGSTFKRPEGYFAGKLIQDCGLKGFHVGDAMVSEKHSGFVINTGHASAKDVTDLIAHVQKCVMDHFGVALEPEIRMIGSFR